MKPDDLDDPTPVEPDAALLTRVHSRSATFRRRRTAQRVTSVVAGVLVLAVAGGIALARGGSSGHSRLATGPPASSTSSTPSTTTTITTPSNATPDLLQGVWRPTLIAGYAGPLTAPPLTQDPVLRIDGAGSWSGSDGCNNLSGTYRRDGSTFRFEHVVSTKIRCAASAPMQYLETAVPATIVGDRLTFVATDQSHVAEFARDNVTARLVLPSTTLVAGSSMKAHVVVENETGSPLTAGGCLSLFQIVLTNDTVPAEANWNACAQRFTIPVGESTYPVTIAGTYLSCGGGPDSTEPRCLPNGDQPPLPPGEYRATLEQNDIVVHAPAPITVHVAAHP